MFDKELPEAYRGRAASLEAWTKAGYARKQAEDVLAVLALGFGWNLEEAHRLRPEDKVWDVYRSYYPRKAWFDSDRPELVRMLEGLNELIDPREPELKMPEDLNVGALVRLATERPARECSCGCHLGVRLMHIARCCAACPHCMIIVGRGRQHTCRYGGGEVWPQRASDPSSDSTSTTEAK